MKEIRNVVLFQGLPGSGKTTAADMLHALVGGARINADQVRATISTDLGFKYEDRIIQAMRMGALAGLALRSPLPIVNPMKENTTDHLNDVAIVDFVCPNDDLLWEFMHGVRFFGLPIINVHTVFMDTIQPKDSRFPDTANLFQPPSNPGHTVSGFKSHDELREIVKKIAINLNINERKAP